MACVLANKRALWVTDLRVLFSCDEHGPIAEACKIKADSHRIKERITFLLRFAFNLLENLKSQSNRIDPGWLSLG